MRIALTTLPVALGWTLLQTGCAHYYWPTSQLETPEAIGPGRLARLEIAAIQSGSDLLEPAAVQPADSLSGKVPDPALSMSIPEYALGATVAVLPELDLGVRITPFAPPVLRAKYQLYGDPESKAEAGGWSAALAASTGFMLATYDGKSATFYTGNASALGGYRIAKSHLASLAAFVGLAGLSGVGAASGSGVKYGASVGYQYDAEALILRTELVWARGTYTETTGPTQAGGFFPGVLLGVRL